MEIDVDTGLCIGAARCLRYAPDLFTQDDEGVVALLPAGIEQADEQGVREAVLACPVQAITLR